MKSVKVGLVSLGCPKNRVDSEMMLGILKNDGYIITPDPSDADAIIVNTCGFIDSAKEEAINTILEMAEYKKENCKALVVTGCLAQRYNKDIMKEMPEVDAILGTGSYCDIAKVVESLINNKEDEANEYKSLSCGSVDVIEYLNGDRVLSTPSTYAYLKIAEGCNNCCTYCVIPSLRGRYRSRPQEDILREANNLIASGIKELILVAQDTTKWGIDIYGRPELASLLRALCNIEGEFRIRILYCYPNDLSDELIQVIADNYKICNYIDLPIQHASNRILKAMGRKDRAEDVGDLIYKLRARIPDLLLRTSIIVGFPGEDESDFEELVTFIKEYKFDRLGVFTYSKEEGTPAASMSGQIHARTKKKRMNEIMKVQQEISRESNINRLNKVYEVIVEGVADDGIFYYGRTYAEAPDIDGTVYFTSPEPVNAGDIINVKMLNYDEYDMIGEMVR